MKLVNVGENTTVEQLVVSTNVLMLIGHSVRS